MRPVQRNNRKKKCRIPLAAFFIAVGLIYVLLLSFNLNRLMKRDDSSVDSSSEPPASTLKGSVLDLDPSSKLVENSQLEQPVDGTPGKENLLMIPGSSTTSSKYAYSFVIGGIHETDQAYKGFLYNILLSISTLQKLGSRADFLVWTELSPNSTLSSLPSTDKELLNSFANVHIKEMPKPKETSFAHLMYTKFNLLGETQYRRIIYMDSDVLPLTNLDYLFHLSDPDNKDVPTILQPNMVWASRGEPSNGGFFMLEPEEGAYDTLQRILAEQRVKGCKLPYPHFSWTEGWGHNFRKEGDEWEGVFKKGNEWHFHGGHADQGLLYYFTKFVQKKVSIVIGHRVQHWVPDPSDIDGSKPPLLLEEQQKPLHEYGPEPIAHQNECNIEKNKDWYECAPVYRDICHFTGSNKPWQEGNEKAMMKWSDTKSTHEPFRLWFRELKELNDYLSMGLDVDNWNQKHLESMKESPLGYMPWYKDNMKCGDEEKKDEAPVDESKKDDLLTGKDKGLNAILKGEVKPEMEDPNVVAYAISFIKCGDHQSNPAGLVDASLVLRHSVHKISSRNPASGSKYDYKMYAIIHQQAEDCAELLKETGFEIVIVDAPLQPTEIRGEYLRENIHKEWCCGYDEFVKLFAYTLPHEVIVHVDIDFAFYKPMDTLFDAIRYDKDSPEGQAARKAIELERPDESYPDEIGAFLTRDWTQVAPNKFPPAYQAGFLVARHDPSAMAEMLDVVREGNYSHGWGWDYGWGNKGYGGVVGSMAMQGLVAYYYDHIRPNNAVELNQCRYNHMGVDVLYRDQPNFRKNVPGVGGCRNALDYCEDCMVTEMDKIYNVHYTLCRKPWQCVATGRPKGRNPTINTNSVHLDHCHMLVKQWHDLRADLEKQLYDLTGDDTIHDGTKGEYHREIFSGHCDGDKDGGYIKIKGETGTMHRINDLY